MLTANITINTYNNGRNIAGRQNSQPIRNYNPLIDRTQPRKKINFGSSVKPGLAKNVAGFFINRLDNVLKNDIGQVAANVINYAGKAVLPPLMILAGSKFTHEDKDSIKSSMLLEPVDAGITLGMAMVFSAIAAVFIGKGAKKGLFGDFFKGGSKLAKKRVGVLKSLSTLGMTFLAIPVAAKLLSRALPEVKKTIDGEKLPLKKRLYTDLYAEGIKPGFGVLTGGDRNGK